MNQKHVVSFIEGMDKDTEYSRYPNTRFSHAENFRFIYDEAHSNGILTNKVGNTLRLEFLGVLLGWTTIRENLILFILYENSTFVLEVPTNDFADSSINLMELINNVPTFKSEYVKLFKNFGHTEDTKIQALARYESSNIQKLYWIDDSSLKFANLADSNLSTYDVSKFESFPKFNVGNINTSITSGNLSAGRVQYTYQLYNVNGSSTLFGPTSSIINISSDDPEKPILFRGDDAGKNTFKGVNVEVSNVNLSDTTVDTNYDRIRLYRIHYGDINLTPSVTIVDERDVSGSTIFISDITLNGLGQVDFAEFISTRVDLQSKTIETKNNILFQGNTTEKVFDVEYDASDNENVNYVFTTDTKIIDFNIDLINTFPIEPIEQFQHASAPVETIVNGYFQKDELYRFGIILFDSKFKPSFVKPIGDIRIPDKNITNISTAVVSVATTIRFTVNNLPEDVQAYQIVYVQRDREKRSVLDTGIAYRMLEDRFLGTLDTDNLSDSYIEYTSPEYLYNDLKEPGQLLEIKNTTPQFSAKTQLKYNDDNLALHEKRIHGDDDPQSYPILDAYYHRGVDDLDFAVAAGENIFKNKVEYTASNTPDDKRAGTKGACTILKLASSINSTDLTPVYARRRKNLNNMQSGRNVLTNNNFYGPIERNIFIPCSRVTPKDQDIIYAYGDTYINYLEFIRTLYPISKNSIGRAMRSIAIPVESTINLQYITNPTITSLVTLPLTEDSPDHYAMQEQSGVHVRGDEFTYIQPFNLYTYNSAYSRQENIKPYTVRPTTLRDDNTIDTRIYHSERKINAELEDGWLVFKQFLDVDTAYGSITRLYNFKNNLYFFQPKAVGILSVDQRELTNTDNSISTLTLGVGGILDRYDYITTESGASYHDSITNSLVAVYYVDDINKTLTRLGEVPEYLSNMYGLKSYMKNIDSKNIQTVFSPRYNNILFKIGDKLLEFSETIGGFTGFLTSAPDKLITVNDSVLLSKADQIYVLDEITNNGEFEDTIHNSKITFIIKPEGRFIQRLDIIELLTYVLQDNTELNETISKFRVSNSYQDTGWIDVQDDVAVRRMRNWRINELRDNTDEGRLKDSYFIFEIEFINNSNKTIKINDLVVTHFPVRPY